MKDVTYDLASLAHSHLSMVLFSDSQFTQVVEYIDIKTSEFISSVFVAWMHHVVQPSKFIFFLSGHLVTNCSSLVASETF